MPEYVPYPPKRIVVPPVVSPPKEEEIAAVVSSLMDCELSMVDFPDRMRAWHLAEERFRAIGRLRRLIAHALHAADPEKNHNPFAAARDIAQRCMPSESKGTKSLVEISQILQNAGVPFIGQIIDHIASECDAMMAMETD